MRRERGRTGQVACGAASHLRLKPCSFHRMSTQSQSRLWSGFSSEIETISINLLHRRHHRVACGAASHLRLKPQVNTFQELNMVLRRMWSGFSSEIETY